MAAELARVLGMGFRKASTHSLLIAQLMRSYIHTGGFRSSGGCRGWETLTLAVDGLSCLYLDSV